MGKVKKVVIDTNIFISGFGWNGKPKTLLTLLKNNQIVNYFSPEIFEELKRVVAYPKLRFPESLQNKILEFVFFKFQACRT
jgi:putative PIN family toxin of toxin-antitoxin system